MSWDRAALKKLDIFGILELLVQFVLALVHVHEDALRTNLSSLSWFLSLESKSLSLFM